MEPEGSLPFQKGPATGRYPAPDDTFPPYLTVSSSLRGIFPSGFQTKLLYAFLISPTRAKCSGHLILLDLITGIILREA
jgi:hypothetical protein